MSLIAVGVRAAGGDSLLSKPKFSGYSMIQNQATMKTDDNSNSFNLRIARLSVEGRILKDFAYKIQGQINGNTATLGSSPRLVDLFVEWQKFPFLKVKAGQFKRPFTMENPMNPIDQGWMGYGQAIQKLAGFSDRTGEHACNGRDIGVQVQGDFLPNSQGRNLLHYQLGVFNGQGINVKDVNEKKDVIGGLWVMPVVGMRVGAFGWEGSYARNTGNQVVSLNKHRYALSAEYKKNDLQLRTEYVHSTGWGFAKTYQNSSDAKDASIKQYATVSGDTIAGNKADGFYALAIVPLLPGKLQGKARYDLYRPTSTWNLSRTQWEIGLNYEFCKYLEVMAEYALVNDRSLSRHNYSILDVELCFRF